MALTKVGSIFTAAVGLVSFPRPFCISAWKRVMMSKRVSSESRMSYRNLSTWNRRQGDQGCLLGAGGGLCSSQGRKFPLPSQSYFSDSGDSFMVWNPKGSLPDPSRSWRQGRELEEQNGMESWEVGIYSSEGQALRKKGFPHFSDGTIEGQK